MASVKAILATMHNHRVSKTITGTLTLEDWPDYVKQAREQLLAQGCPAEQITETDNALEFGANQYVLKPKHSRYSEGTLLVRSKDYCFTPDDGSTGPVYGDIKGLKVLDATTLQKIYNNGMTVTFRRIEP